MVGARRSSALTVPCTEYIVLGTGAAAKVTRQRKRTHRVIAALARTACPTTHLLTTHILTARIACPTAF